MATRHRGAARVWLASALLLIPAVVRVTAAGAVSLPPPAAAPAGAIAYEWLGQSSSPGGPQPIGIGVVRPDGTENRQLTDGEGTSDFHPAWSPDGSAIAFEHSASGQSSSLNSFE